MELTKTQIYVILALRSTGKFTFLTSENIAAGIILNGLFEMLDEGIVVADSKGRLKIEKGLPGKYDYLYPLYTNIKCTPTKTIHKWFEMYAYNIGQKDVKNLVNSIVDSLRQKSCIDISVNNGILRKKIRYLVKSDALEVAEETYKKMVIGGSSEGDIVFAAVLNANKLDMGIVKTKEVQERISSFKRTKIWKYAVDCVRQIENQSFNVQLSSYQP